MRILSWNVNGIRTVRQYRPLYKLKWSECLEALEADIICFQETKITRKQLLVEDRDMCLPKGYYAFYNLHPTKGYSGTATFVRDSVCTPQRAEEGITGNLVKDRRDSKTAIGGYPDLLAPESPQFDLIDREGRAVVVDCGMFVLFNLYCPNETDEGRREYKMAYYTTLEERVHNLLEAGREVIIVGDLNIAHLPIDHADSVHAKINAETHLDQHPARRWLDRFLTPVGRFMDAGRHMHPRRRFMYTCWNTIKNSRASNYGARIDFTLLSPGLVDWVKDAGIQPDVQGSDHCPVYVDLHDEITLPDGSIVKLRDKLSQEAKPPPLATSSWPEHSGRRIQSFFAAGPSAATPSPSPAPNLAASSPSPVPSTATRMPPSAAQKEERSRSMSSQEPVSLTESRSEKVQTETTSSSRGSQSPGKAVKRPEGQAKSKEKVTVNGSARKGAQQATLKSFFGKSPKEAELPAFKAEEEELERQEAAGEAAGLVAESEPSPSKAPLKEGEMVEEEDSGAARVQSSLAWGSIFAPRASPRCGGHNEPAKPWTVNKPGPNHGRKFWMCARPVGGTGEPDHDKQFRCGFWKWDSEVRTKAQREDSDEATGGRKSFHEVAGRAPMLGSGEKRTLPSHSASSPVKRRRDA